MGLNTTPPAPGGAPGRLAGLRRWAEPALLAVTLAALVAGGAAWLAGDATAAGYCWLAGTLSALPPALAWLVAALRRRQAGVDLIAVLSLGGTAAVGEYLAGALIALMLATGRALDAAAQRRASHDLRSLVEHAPRTARRRIGQVVATVPLADVVVGDTLVVGPGEVVPVDGTVAADLAVLDESVLTGEPLAVERVSGDVVRSGVVNAGAAFELRAAATAEESTYAGIVRLAQQAGAESAPVVRLADRYAAWFLPLSLLVAGVAWAAGGSARRAVAVLVVATPCPLLLAVPVAIVAGLARTSRLGVLVRTGGALESLGRATTLAMDKTGTLTVGAPKVVEVAAAPGWEAGEVLRLAASADQMSPHVLAAGIVAEARARGLELTLPQDVVEQPGVGVAATVGGCRAQVGRRELPPEAGWAHAARNRAVLDGAIAVWTSVDGELVGAVLLRDPQRRDAPLTLRRLRAAGLRRLVMLTGDREEPARQIGAVLGLDAVYARQSPADKVAAVRAERERAGTIMVGDGVNDAPALAAATVGVAMGARGATASSEAADVVLANDRLDRLADAVEIARAARAIAVQSAAIGMALSLAAMVVAAVGLLPPAAGALLQEGIDVAVIVNALRALRIRPAGQVKISPATDQMLRRFAAEHDELRDALTLLRQAADLVASGPSPQALSALRQAHDFLVDQLLPHERAEERQLYPALAGPLGGPETTAAMSRMHAEIARLSDRLGTHLRMADAAGGLPAEQVDDIAACLYGLHTMLRLHFVVEEEHYFTLSTDQDQDGGEPR